MIPQPVNHILAHAVHLEVNSAVILNITIVLQRKAKLDVEKLTNTSIHCQKLVIPVILIPQEEIVPGAIIVMLLFFLYVQ